MEEFEDAVFERNEREVQCWFIKTAVGGIRAHVRCTGKGRKTRCIPLRKEVIAVIRECLNERNCQPDNPVFINAHHQRLSRDRVQYIVAQHVKTAQGKCPSLKTKRVSPHVLRHYAAGGIGVTAPR